MPSLSRIQQPSIDASAQFMGFKNRIINGAMMIDQRNAGASVTPTTNLTFTLDRWKTYLTQSSKFSVQQNAGSVTPPAGFTNYLGITSLSAYSVLSTDYFVLSQPIEGYNTADLGWGTANAQPVTLSFRVYSSLTGTFGGSVYNNAGNRSYPFTYTVSSANTWTTVSVTIPGDTSGAWLTNNSVGINVFFGLGVGSNFSGAAGAWNGSLNLSATGATSVVGTSGATFYITGVQLEKGSTATSFDYRPYGTELALCQRYYWAADCGGFAYAQLMGDGQTWRVGLFSTPTTMRASPTISGISGTTNGTLTGNNSLSEGSTADVIQIRMDVTPATAWSKITSFKAAAEL
jgi:hypothetical protein